MDIWIYPDRVEICPSGDAVYRMSLDSLDKIEKAIEIIRSIQKIAPLETATITTL